MLGSCMIALVVSIASAVPVEADYGTAYAAAQSAGKMLIVDVGTSATLAQVDAKFADEFVFCEVERDATVVSGGREIRLVDHPAFSDLQGPGVAVVDLKGEAYRGQVVSALPQRHVTQSRVEMLLTLPEGSLTQRTLVWALRIHPEQPRSVWGAPAPELMAHAQNHSGVQARSNNQHHNLPIGIASSEIVAESWPWNHHVVDAAIDVVDSWRQSSGHWGAARRGWTYYGYDMKSNGGKWFATGVFR